MTRIYVVMGAIHTDYDEALKDAKSLSDLTGRPVQIKEYELTNTITIEKAS